MLFWERVQILEIQSGTGSPTPERFRVRMKPKGGGSSTYRSTRRDDLSGRERWNYA